MDVGGMQSLEMMVAGREARELLQTTAAGETSSWLAAQLSRAVELTRPFLMLFRRPRARITRPKAESLARVNYEEKMNFSSERTSPIDNSSESGCDSSI